MRTNRKRGLTRGGETWWGYSGTHTAETVTVDGAQRTLVTIKRSGQLTVIGPLDADVWMCGCGASGGVGIPGTKAGDGGAGAKCAQALGMRLVTGAMNVAQTVYETTMYQGMSAASATSKSGGTGGGGGAAANVANEGGTGDGVAKVPFGLTALFSAHCAGGGGGGFRGETVYGGTGGAGGTNGGSGGASTRAMTYNFGAGGAVGGGAGGVGHNSTPAATNNGGNATQTQYGSGGGGGGSGLNATAASTGGQGAPGIIYLLLK